MSRVYSMAVSARENCGIMKRENILNPELAIQLEQLDGQLGAVMSFLADAEEKAMTTEAVGVWIETVKTWVYDVDDLLDLLSTLTLKKRYSVTITTRSKIIKEVRCLFSKLVPKDNVLSFPRPMINKINIIHTELCSLQNDGEIQHGLREKKSFEKQISSLIKDNVGSQGDPLERPHVDIKRDDDKNTILKMLLDRRSKETITIIPIVGIEGIGKTTVAREVYSDARVNQQFELQLWVRVPEEFNLGEVIMKIIAMDRDPLANVFRGLDQSRSRLGTIIERKKYLLVLDGIRETGVNLGWLGQEWPRLKDFLSVGAKGSRILVTTNSFHVARVMGTTEPHILTDQKDGLWPCFEKIAFTDQPEEDIKKIGKEIFDRCPKIPLAIRIIGQLLRSRNSAQKWKSFRDKELRKIEPMHRNLHPTDLGNLIEPTLRLNYSLLPPPLKSCFAYCALFPKDSVLNKQELINLWMAQGFIQDIDGRSLEDIGDAFFMELLDRSFFQNVEKDELGFIIRCKMHDVMHDLALDVAKTESKILADWDAVDVNEYLRHVSLGFRVNPSWDELPPSLLKKNLRTLLLVKDPQPANKVCNPLCKKIVSSFGCLRVLDLHDLGITTLPNSIGKLVHLRYLNLSGNDRLSRLPNSVTDLHKLQTLKLNFCQALEKLPRDIEKLVSLRNLEINECGQLKDMPLGLEKLTSLQRLDRFITRRRSSVSRAIGGLRVLQNLNYLRGNLRIEIHNHGDDDMVSEAREADLESKISLTGLRVEWRCRRDETNNESARDESENSEKILEHLKPHSDVKMLGIEAYIGQKLPTWMMEDIHNTLGNLVHVSIDGCSKCQLLPPFSQLRKLKYLRLQHMDAIDYMEQDIRGAIPTSSTSSSCPPPEVFFPCLEELTLRSFHNLKLWWRGIEEAPQNLALPSFPCLKKLTMWRCPKLTFMPAHRDTTHVSLRNVHEALLQQSLMNATGLANFFIGDLKQLTSLTTKNFRSLEQLKVQDCPNLENFSTGSLSVLCKAEIKGVKTLHEPFGELSALEELEVAECEALTFSSDIIGEGNYSLPGRALGWLRSIYGQFGTIQGGQAEGRLPWKAFTRLRSLNLREIKTMKRLPTGLRQVTTLQSLRLSQCTALIELPEWIDNLTSLQWLTIEWCPEIQSLPEQISQVPCLYKLEITECSKLLERCKEPTGADCYKIRDIPRVVLHRSWRYGANL